MESFLPAERGRQHRATRLGTSSSHGGPTSTGSLTVAVIGSARFAVADRFGADQHEGYQRAEDGERHASAKRPPEALDEGSVRRVCDAMGHRVRPRSREGDEHG